ncbi:MAG: hypothetical protein HRU11_13055, partial [Parvularculaceae bacterium]|nr:hypothetical protein [Parvularculaceae bacterium]
MVERARKMCCLALALAACSGGGGSGSQTPPPPINRAPVVTIAGPSSVNEADIFSLMADASDVDGLVDGIVWTQTAGPT